MENKLQEMIKHSHKIVVAQEEFLSALRDDLQQSYATEADCASMESIDNSYIVSFSVALQRMCEIVTNK